MAHSNSNWIVRARDDGSVHAVEISVPWLLWDDHFCLLCFSWIRGLHIIFGRVWSKVSIVSSLHLSSAHHPISVFSDGYTIFSLLSALWWHSRTCFDLVLARFGGSWADHLWWSSRTIIAITLALVCLPPSEALCGHPWRTPPVH